MPQPVSATSSSTVSAAVARVATSSRFTRESRMASAALSTRFTTTRLNCSGSTCTGGSSGARSTRRSMPSSRPANTSSALRTISFRSLRHRLRGGKARELREFVRQRLHRLHFARNGGRRIPAECAANPCGNAAAVQQARDALGRKRDRRQRILELMGDAARHLVPGRGLLGAQQLAGVFEHQHETRRRRLGRRQPGDSAETVTARCRTCARTIPVRSGWPPLRCAARASSDIGSPWRPRRENRSSRCAARPRFCSSGNSPCKARFTRRMPPSAVSEMTPVGMLSRIASVNRRRLSSSRLLASSSCIISLKARTSVASSSIAVRGNAMAQVALAHLAGRPQQRRNRHADLPRQHQRDPGGDEQNEQRDQQQEQHVQSADGAACRRRAVRTR